MLGYVLGILFIILAVIGFISEQIPGVYNRTPRNCKNTLRTDAKILDIKHEGHSRKIGTHIETSVIFNDGFVYVSHKSQPTLMGVMMTGKIKDEILNDAYEAHRAAIRRYGAVDNNELKQKEEDMYIYYDKDGNISETPTSHRVRRE